MKWDLAERTEDALVAYLKTKCGSDIRVCAAWERDEPQYPAAVVYAGGDGPISETAEWHDARSIAVSVAVLTEAAHELGADGAIVRTARERNAAARSQVCDALFITGLLAQLNAQGVADVAFSMAQFDRVDRSVDGRYLVSTIGGTVIAEPVTGS